MAKRYKIYPIKTIKDWQGEDWDVYEEVKTSVGVMVYRGWKHRYRTGTFAIIFSAELAEFLRQNGLYYASEQLGISVSKLSRLRRELNIQKKISKPDHTWIKAHQTEILNESYQLLNEKYGLSKKQVRSYTCYLLKYAGVLRSKPLRTTQQQIQNEQWYQQNKQAMVDMTVKQISQTYGVSSAKAGKVYMRICREFQLPMLADRVQKRVEQRRKWLIDNQEQILRTDIRIKQIAQNLDQTEKQILHARTQLKIILENKGR